MFGLLVEGMYFGFIPSFSVEQSMNISSGLVLNNIFIAWSVFFLVSLLMNYVSRSLRKTKSELQLAKKELEVNNRLTVAGEVSAQLAHEIRNPLAGIKINTQILERKEDLLPMEKRLIEGTQEGVGKIQKIVDDVKLYYVYKHQWLIPARCYAARPSPDVEGR